jgi:predicted transcriptional regulator
MKTALIEVRTDTENVRREMKENFLTAWKTGVPSDPLATFTFSSATQLFSVFTANRFALIEQLQKSGPVSIRQAARDANRDIRRVHDDVSVLLDWGIVEKDETGKIFVPFDVIHAGFDLKAAA